MSDLYSDFYVLSAMTRLEPELPELLGESWNEMQTAIETDLDALRGSSNVEEQAKLAEHLVDTVDGFSNTRKRLNVELNLQELIKQYLQEELQSLSAQLGTDSIQLQASLSATIYSLRWSVDPEDIPPIEEMVTRRVTVKPGGIGGAQSIKFRNLNLDFGEMSLIAGGAFLAGHEILKEPNGFIIAASVLMTISAVYKAATVKIEEQDAIVFWSFIQARGKDNTATTSAIVASTKQECVKYHREPLSDAVIHRALINLEALKSVVRLDGKPNVWKLIEQFKIKP